MDEINPWRKQSDHGGLIQLAGDSALGIKRRDVMVEIIGKIIFKMRTKSNRPSGIGDLSKEEKLKLIYAERDLNDQVCNELFKKYGISIRVHL